MQFQEPRMKYLTKTILLFFSAGITSLAYTHGNNLPEIPNEKFKLDKGLTMNVHCL